MISPKPEITLQQVLASSKTWYSTMDSKKVRANKDIQSARVTNINNLVYNPSTRTWDKTGRGVRVEVLVISRPKSYKKLDTFKVHKYPVIFLLNDIKKGTNTFVRWRTGSLKRPVLPPRGAKLTRQQRIQFANANVRNMVQLQFFFELEWVLSRYNLLFGINWANRPPRIKNPKQIPFFDKHAWYVVQKLIIPLLKSGKLERYSKNE